MLMLYLTSVNENGPDAGTLEQLLGRISEKDTEALASLYQAAREPVYSLALSILKNAHDAEDVLHDCFVNIFHSASGYRPRGKPMAWILTVARNLSLRRLNERGRGELMAQEDWESIPDSPGITPEDKLLLAGCLELLSQEERQIVTLHASGLKHRETAELISIPLPTVLSKYHRAIKKLRKALEGPAPEKKPGRRAEK